jgi:superfamily II DNA or RNA helicase
MSDYRPMPGNLVRARGRDWVVQAGSDDTVLLLRPLRGGDDVVCLAPDLEKEPVAPAFFEDPDPSQLSNMRSGALFREALMLKLRNGAGPFRSFGHIAFQPRAYQLVPLLMALKLDPVRLLISDDVGIGKTIEAGLIVRELWDRFEIDRFAVLCPPHLVDQWVGELHTRFNFPAVALTASSVSSLERTLPVGQSLFDRYPVLVVSLDYIKNPVHRENFLSTAPDCIVVDEVHSCTSKGTNQQLRFELLKKLARDKNRSLIMLTATPHSGDDEAFHNLLGLLDEKYLSLGQDPGTDKSLREELASQFVQRRRMDIIEWKDDSIFPSRMVKEISYHLNDDWRLFFEDVRVYCYTLAKTYEKNQTPAGKMIWYAILALFRCVASSPASAVSVLTTRLQNLTGDEFSLDQADILDEEAVDFSVDDVTPTQLFNETQDLKRLLKQAQQLLVQKDPKLEKLVAHLEGSLLKDGFRPVIFCRYISTAKYVGEYLRAKFTKFQIDIVTGELSAEERQEHIALLGKTENPILVATDCLSEGINLQEYFNAVLHYDLAWNPTRHEQREGRVDRFGQVAKEVRCTMMYCEDNPVDGFILNVILRKATAIKQELGVMVPIPENSAAVGNALVQAALLKKSFKTPGGQISFDFGEIQQATEAFEGPWKDARENAKKNKAIFAQRSLHPQDVIPEWMEEQEVLGSAFTIKDMMGTLLQRLGNPLKEISDKEYELNPASLPEELKARFIEATYHKPVRLSLSYPPSVGAEFIHRSHPVVELLADYIVENTLDYRNEKPIGGRCAVIETSDVDKVHSLFLVRVRHQISTKLNGKSRYLMAEELIVIGSKGMVNPKWIDEKEALQLFACKPSGTLSMGAQQQNIEKALYFYRSQQTSIEQLCMRHANKLLDHNRRVRSAASAKGAVSVNPCFPADLMGVYVLLPSVDLL